VGSVVHQVQHAFERRPLDVDAVVELVGDGTRLVSGSP
jgi:hypothetical protein